MTEKKNIKLSLIYILFIIYATTIPFSFVGSMDAFLHKLYSIRWTLYITGGRRESLTDIFSNIVLFVPLGFCLASFFIKPGKIFLTVFLSCLIGFSISLTVEMIQLFTAERVSSVTDIFNNSLGVFLGSSIAVLYHNKISIFIKPYIQKFFKRPLIEVYTVLTAGGILFFALSPFDFSVDMDDLKRGVKFFLAHFTVLPEWSYMQSSINNFFFFFILSFLGIFSIFNRGLSWIYIKLFFLFNILFAVGIEFFQLMIVSRGSSLSNLVFALGGSCTGIILSICLFNENSMIRTAKRCFMTIYIVYVLFNYMFPFKFTVNITDNVSVISLVPFAMYFVKTNLFSFADFFEQTFMFIPLGVLGIMNLTRSPKKSFAVGFVCGAILEFGQAMIETRYCDITDAIMAGAGCYIGNYCVLRFYAFQEKLKSNSIIINQ